jgi:hypothetical protein
MSLVQLKIERERRRQGSALMGKMKVGGHWLTSTTHAWGRVTNGGTQLGDARSGGDGSGTGGGRRRRAWAGSVELGLMTWADSREKGRGPQEVMGRIEYML